MKTKRLTESAMLLALAIVLELISKAIIPEMPFGGQVTLVAMLPVVLISYRYGVKWGFVSGFCYALLEMALGAKTVSAAFQPGYFGDGTMIFKAILMCLLDYLLAYTMMGLGGVFRDKIKNPGTSLMCGSLVALGARYLSHILSGYLLFSVNPGMVLTSLKTISPSFVRNISTRAKPEHPNALYIFRAVAFILCAVSPSTRAGT